MTSQDRLRIEPLTPAFGASVSGFSVADGCDDARFARIKAAFEDYSVLVFPDQPVTDDQQIAFSERFGALEETLKGAIGSGGKVARISNTLPDGTKKDPDGQLALFGRANQYWHTDSSFKAVPAMASLLSARTLPAAGGDTAFASTRAAYAALPEAMKARLAGLIAMHSIAESRERLSPGAVTEAQKQALPPVAQALVRTNPANGQKSLLIGSHVSGIVGMAETEARALHDELLSFATGPRFTYHHVWRDHDIVMWDNRAVLHRGFAYDEVNDTRILIRTTVAGSGPTVRHGAIVAGA